MSRVKGRAPIKFRKKPVVVEAMRFESMDDYFTPLIPGPQIGGEACPD